VPRHHGTTARMHRDPAGRYVMTFESTGHKPVDAVVVRSVGSRRYQQYLAQANGALWRLPMAYHVEERRWFHMAGALTIVNPSRLSPARAADLCGRCHALRCTSCHGMHDGDPRGAASGAACLTRAHMLLAAVEGDRYPAVRHLAARALGQLLSAVHATRDDGVARAALAIDATGDPEARARAVASIRAALAAGGCAGRAPSDRFAAGEGAPDPARLARLRAEARRADIDIGE